MNEAAFFSQVIVTSQHGEKYLGQISGVDTTAAAREYIRTCVQNNLPIELHNVRLFACQVQPEVGADGRVRGIRTFAALLPVDVFSGPMEVLSVRPSSWYFISEVPSFLSKFNQLLEAAEANEQANRAREHGLHLPGRS